MNQTIQVGQSRPALDVVLALVAVLSFGAGVMVAMLAMQDSPRAMPPTMEMGEP